MSSYTIKTKNKRFNEINNNLNKLTKEKISDYFINDGYFPEEQFLPSDFFLSCGLAKNASVKKYLKKIDYSKYIPDGKPTLLYFPKTKYTLRTLSVPPFINHLYLTKFVSENWQIFKKHLTLDEKKDNIIPYSVPLFIEGKKRSEIGISNHKVLSEIDLQSLLRDYTHCVFLDIKDFYPSIYVHSLAWALDKRTRHDNTCLCKGRDKCKFHNYNYPANKLDELTRKLNRNRTKGILIGPYTSDFSSEILLRSIDKELSKKFIKQSNKYIGFRFKDDYVFLTKNQDLADKIRMEMQKILDEYHLGVNDDKTFCSDVDSLEDTKYWKVELKQIKNEIDQKLNKKEKIFELDESDIIFWLKTTRDLYKKYKDQYIIKAILGYFIREGIEKIEIKKKVTDANPHLVDIEENYIAVFSHFSTLCKLVPSAWPSFLAFIYYCYKGTSNKEVKTCIQDYLVRLIESFLEKDEIFPLIWTLYITRRCKLEIDKKITNKIIKKYKSNWLIESFFDINKSKIVLNDETIFLVNNGKQKEIPLYKIISVFGYRQLIKQSKK